MKVEPLLDQIKMFLFAQWFESRDLKTMEICF